MSTAGTLGPSLLLEKDSKALPELHEEQLPRGIA